jgi:hypothetical protein
MDGFAAQRPRHQISEAERTLLDAFDRRMQVDLLERAAPACSPRDGGTPA